MIKNHMKYYLLLSSLLLILTSSVKHNFSLTTWTLNIENDTRSFKAYIPSTLSLDLIDNGLIDSDPYYRDNFLKYYEYETKDASYHTNFYISS